MLGVTLVVYICTSLDPLIGGKQVQGQVVHAYLDFPKLNLPLSRKQWFLILTVNVELSYEVLLRGWVFAPELWEAVCSKNNSTNPCWKQANIHRDQVEGRNQVSNSQLAVYRGCNCSCWWIAWLIFIGEMRSWNYRRICLCLRLGDEIAREQTLFGLRQR